ncbi:DUF1453 domain-containing protein [Streptacidiphilus monticola]|jgi:hypothetical protein|uniref:DUF1453 domain-containing protein n=1 Tax=Streptacidiphilus monticola TaxID=2161674 RepID=A0ABW1G4V4_9ACTN
MNSAASTLLVIAAVVLVLARQLTARRVGDDWRKAFVLPVVLAAVALEDGHLIDPAHRPLAVGFLVVGLILEAALGAVWGLTTRLWRDESGALWAKGTLLSLLAWIGMVVVRAGLYGAGHALGLAQGQGDLLLALAVLVAVRGVVLRLRAQAVAPAYGGSANVI